MYEIELNGCSREPLSNYLKALGIFRLVSEQKDESAEGKWENGHFILKSKLNEEELIKFFSDEYRPTPIASPWNNAFNEKSIFDSNKERFREFNEVKKIIEYIKQDEKYGNYEKAKGKEKQLLKLTLVQSLRNQLPDNAIRWIDAIYVINKNKLFINPLLGFGGGNDARAEYSVIFLKYILEELINLDINKTKKLKNSLFGLNINVFENKTFGQFNPYNVGNFNASSNGNSDSISNPWDFIFTLEGSILFSGSATKKYNPSLIHQKGGNIAGSAFPFMVNAVNGGNDTLSEEDCNRSKEIWFPTWDKFTSLKEIETLISEGRADFGNKTVKNTIELIDAIENYKVDKGLSSFNRYIFLKRNGETHFAVKMGEFNTKENKNMYLIKGFVNLYDILSKDKKIPIKNFTNIIFNIYNYGIDKTDNMQNAILELTNLARYIVKRYDFNSKSKIKEFILNPKLNKDLTKYIDDKSIEFRLAYSLAYSLQHNYINRLNSDTGKGNKTADKIKILSKWLKYEKNDISWFNLVMNDYILYLNGISTKNYSSYEESIINGYNNLNDINSFINKKIDYKKLINLTLGFLIFFNFKGFEGNYELYSLENNDIKDTAVPEIYYFIEKLCFSNKKVRLMHGIYKKLVAGDWKYALNLSLWRLRSDNISIPNLELDITSDDSKVISAALIFPLDYNIRSLKMLFNTLTETD